MRRGNSTIAGGLAFVSLLGCLAVSTPCKAGETIRIGGTGSALAAMRILGAEFQKRDPEINVEVLVSLGTLGGIEALAEGAIDIGLAARGLKPEELAKGIPGGRLHDHRADLRRQSSGPGLRYSKCGTARPVSEPTADLGGRHAVEAHSPGAIG